MLDMIRVVVVADSGAVLARLTAAVGLVPGAYIVRHGSSCGPVDRLVATLAPDLVVIGDLREPVNGPARLAEIERAAPTAQVVLAPGYLEPPALGALLRDAMTQRLVSHAAVDVRQTAAAA
jgi:chemotaxis response regulator CheB